MYVLLTEQHCRLPILDVCAGALAGGADCIQLREKGKSDRELLSLAAKIRRCCRQARSLFLMNDRADLAILADADGVHLGQDDLAVPQARSLLAGHMVVGQSTHSLGQARAALEQLPDYIALGAVFSSSTKPRAAAVDLATLAQVAQFCHRPLIAIGGISDQNAASAIAAGATGVAVCQAVTAAADPENAARAIKQQLPKTDNARV